MPVRTLPECHADSSVKKTTIEHDLNGETLIECDQQILKEIGVRKVGDRIRMLEAIKQLRKQAISEDKEKALASRTSLVRRPAL